MTGTIAADATTTTTIQLKRAVSLLRVRIDQTDITSEANTILFTGTGTANTSIRLRRHASSLKLTIPAASPYTTPLFGGNKIDYAFVSTKAFKNAEPGSGYSGSMGIDAADFTLWNDYVILPGGHASTGAEKFNLLLSGHAPSGNTLRSNMRTGNWELVLVSAQGATLTSPTVGQSMTTREMYEYTPSIDADGYLNHAGAAEIFTRRIDNL